MVLNQQHYSLVRRILSDADITVIVINKLRLATRYILLLFIYLFIYYAKAAEHSKKAY